MADMTITEARSHMLGLPEKLAKDRERVVRVTRRGQPVLAVVTWDVYESILETLDVLSDPEDAAALRRSLEDLREGRVISQDETARRFGL